MNPEDILPIPPGEVNNKTQIFKKCPSCLSEKNLNEFNIDRKSTDGHTSYCKTCDREKNKRRYVSRKEAKLNQSDRWNAANPDKRSAYNRKYREKTASKTDTSL